MRIVLLLLIPLLVGTRPAHAEDVNSFASNPKVLRAVSELYGLDERGAAQRLQKESEATAVYRRVRHLGLESYGGAWFDQDSQRLTVALADPDERELVSTLGADVVIRCCSLQDLKSRLAEGVERVESVAGRGAVAQSYVDVPAGIARIVVLEQHYSRAKSVVIPARVEIAKTQTRPRVAS
jgi:streptogrisin C